MGDHIMEAQAQEDELSLPKGMLHTPPSTLHLDLDLTSHSPTHTATVFKLINEMMPSDVQCAKETRDLLIECCVEFIHLIASEANDLCEKDAKKTIAAEHVVGALRALGFEAFVREVEGVLKEHKTAAKVCLGTALVWTLDSGLDWSDGRSRGVTVTSYELRGTDMDTSHRAFVCHTNPCMSHPFPVSPCVFH